jgi:hypothetical protein
VNRKPPKRGGGWRRPPREGLIGRTEAALLLQCDRIWIRRHYQKNGLLKAAVTEPDGVEWFELEAVKLLASSMKRKRGRKSSSTRLRAVRSPSELLPADYYPELRARRAPVCEAPRPFVKARPSAERPSLRYAGSMPRGVGPRTEIRKEWWDAELTPLAPEVDASPQRAAAPGGTTEIDPRWFDKDFKPDD